MFSQNTGKYGPEIIPYLDSFHAVIRFVFERVFISEQIAENRFGALLEIGDKCITKFNVSYMILQFRFKTLWKISKPYCMTLKTVAR